VFSICYRTSRNYIALSCESKSDNEGGRRALTNREVLRESLFNLPIVALELVDGSLCNVLLLVFSQRFFTPRIKDKALRSPILTMRTKFLRSPE
jgi:hypothetical protein